VQDAPCDLAPEQEAHPQSALWGVFACGGGFYDIAGEGCAGSISGGGGSGDVVPPLVCLLSPS